jgi:p-aminobenzoyl-glutamate transporter AbgT
MFTETKGVVRFVILSTITVQCLSRVASIVTAGYIVNQYYFVFAKGVVRLIVAGYVLT